MRRFLFRRLAQAAAIVFLVTTITFVLIHLAPGDPFFSGSDSGYVTAEMRDRWRAEFGLDRPLAEQYVRFLANAARGNFGWSFSLRRPVGEAVLAFLPNTLLLMSVAIVLTFVVGIALGILQALRPGGTADRVLGGASLFFYSMPEFWVALMAVLVFAYHFRLFPVGGIIDPVLHDYLGFWGRVGDRLRHLVLPALTLALTSAAGIARYQRAAMLDVVRRDFVRTARAKGLPERRVVLRHALRNALLPTITLAGIYFPYLLSGVVFVETVFSWPGIGRMATAAIASRDYPLVTVGVIIGGAMVALGSLLADLAAAAVDPRLRA
ncbi:MAG TPA: ABC transporter permease [Gemmatimonadaceae bacterium]|nr:ABC transporter permease [Gemmatimonadaceae bacterium]